MSPSSPLPAEPSTRPQRLGVGPVPQRLAAQMAAEQIRAVRAAGTEVMAPARS